MPNAQFFEIVKYWTERQPVRELRGLGYFDRMRRFPMAVAGSGQIDTKRQTLAPGPLSFYRRLSERSLFIFLSPAFIYLALIETIVGYRRAGLDKLLGPDGYMRIVRIRGGLQAGWFTHVVANDNAGNGTVIHWSHLIDAAVIALSAPLRLVLPQSTALLVAASVTGPMVAVLLAAVLVWAVAPLIQSGRAWLWIGPFAVLLSPAIFTFGLLGYVHHHLLLVVLAVAVAGCAGRAATGRTGSGIWCGIWAAVGIWLSPEALPYVLMAMGTMGVAWCLKPAAIARPLRSCGTAFVATMVIAVLIDPPSGGWLSPEVDCVSIVFVVLAALICAAAWLLALSGPRMTSVWIRSCGSVLIGVAVIGLWLWLYPRLTQGLGGLVPAQDADVLFGAIAEMQPVTHDLHGLSLLMTGAFAVVLALRLAWRQRSALWLYAAGCGCVVVALAASHVRFIAYPEASGVLMLLATLGWAGSPPQTYSRLSMFRAAVTAIFLFGPLATMAWSGKLEPYDPMAHCDVAEIAPALRQERNAIVLTEISDTPEVLWRAPVRTVGSLYHRSSSAFLLARDAWRTVPSDAVPEAVLATGATDILACDLTGRTALVGDLPPVTLQDRLARHEVPPWLHEIGHGGGYVLYRIVSDQSAIHASQISPATARLPKITGGRP
jgi:hypothetical protein